MDCRSGPSRSDAPGDLDIAFAVRSSAISEDSASAYSEAQSLDPAHEMAVVVQRLVRADVSGVSFTADPVTGSHTCMVGNLVHGPGEQLVSGETIGRACALARPWGRFSGPPELKRFARQLCREAFRRRWGAFRR
jgi:pyruvate,water dikinase